MRLPSNKLSFAVFVALTVCVNTSFARALINSMSPEELKVTYTLPSGAEESVTLAPPGSTIGVTTVPMDREVNKLNVSITNGAGQYLPKARCLMTATMY